MLSEVEFMLPNPFLKCFNEQLLELLSITICHVVMRNLKRSKDISPTISLDLPCGLAKVGLHKFPNPKICKINSPKLKLAFRARVVSAVAAAILVEHPLESRQARSLRHPDY